MRGNITIILRVMLGAVIALAIFFDMFVSRSFYFPDPRQVVFILSCVIIMLLSYLTFDLKTMKKSVSRNQISLDGAIMVVFLLLAYFSYFGTSMGDKPDINLEGDSAILASLAAYYDAPVNFRKELIFQFPEFGWFYASAFILLIHLVILVVHHYGTDINQSRFRLSSATFMAFTCYVNTITKIGL